MFLRQCWAAPLTSAPTCHMPQLMFHVLLSPSLLTSLASRLLLFRPLHKLPLGSLLLLREGLRKASALPVFLVLPLVLL